MKRLSTIAAAALCAGGAAFAQPAPEAPRPGPDLRGQILGGPMRHDLLFMAGAQLEQERVVQGAPYCADALHETVQLLADGNRIVRRQASRQCRDGQGRTRQEVTAPGGQVRVYLRDPVAHEAWLLDAERKLAVRLDGQRMAMGPNADPRMWDRVVGWSHDLRDRVRQGLRMGHAEAPPPAMADAPDAARIESGPPPLMGRMPPPIALQARLPGPRGPGAATLLPGETIEGLRADGKRTVWTIEAGKIGNEKPISIVNEVWSSPELGITLKTRDLDPVVGEDSFRLRNVARGEPDGQLFKVPAEFAKVSPPAAMMRPRP
ncbi:hypothetical protein GCM10027034_43690 [Ramlibacter solisilvae]|nr:hypothetical protein [Ramlibacter tataouinensis]